MRQCQNLAWACNCLSEWDNRWISGATAPACNGHVMPVPLSAQPVLRLLNNLLSFFTSPCQITNVQILCNDTIWHTYINKHICMYIYIYMYMYIYIIYNNNILYIQICQTMPKSDPGVWLPPGQWPIVPGYDWLPSSAELRQQHA